MKTKLFAIAAVAALCGCGPKLVIIHTNDTHSHMDPLRDGKGGIAFDIGLSRILGHQGRSNKTGQQQKEQRPEGKPAKGGGCHHAAKLAKRIHFIKREIRHVAVIHSIGFRENRPALRLVQLWIAVAGGIMGDV